MAQATTEADAALEAARQMESDNGTVTTWDNSATSDRFTFRYTGVVHAYRLPDGWELVGFGDGWFSLEPEQ